MDNGKVISIGRFICLICVVGIVMSGCGKQESVKGAVGAASGAVVGSSFCGDRYKGTGAFIGSLIGHAIGSEVGRAEDKQDKIELREKVQAQNTREVRDLLAENRHLCTQLKRWCSRCETHVGVAGALSCPECGTRLIYEKTCRRCSASFSPKLGYRYCPYCPVTVALRGR